MRFNFIPLIQLAVAGIATANFFHRNLAYHSPFATHPQLGHDTSKINENCIQRRQNMDSAAFKDGHYATFYGGDFSNTPFIWGGGVNFTHAGKEGDPFDTSVLLWTRAVPLASSGGAVPNVDVPVCVAYQVGTTPDLSGRIVSRGEAFTSYDVDWTVKVEATGLKPDTKYFYSFKDCATAATRWFNAYGFAAHNTSADIFIHLGDYIYESLGNGAHIGRQTLGRELATIKDYRQRLNQYRTDQSLVDAHLRAPWITVSDNSWKAGTADSNDTTVGCAFSASGACFTDRKLAAVRAYHEWMPIRQVDPQDKLRIWRNFQIGKLLDLTMLDTRQYDRDITDMYYNTDVNTIASFANRSLMGAAQEKWFFDTVSESKSRGAVWRVVGQQIVFTQLNELGSCTFSFPTSHDAWDGYRANRKRVLDHISQNRISNTVILSGDSHANWVSDLAYPNDTTTYDPVTGKGAIGVEFAGTAVTSGSSFGSGITPAAANAVSTQLVGLNPDLQWSEGSYRGFFTLSIDSLHLNATYYGMNNISFANLDGFATAQFVVKAGENKLSRPVAGGSVLAGVLQSQLPASNSTN
ncbi:PhoD-like protein [Pholiota conissans]|uniref:PhoD-like protein n=1 Tax=Pholiota conissans TaxID=109636 RepID=A0A9P6D1D6_9AGAR|nr:PhoD-like protein [Pholiota conissans]